MARLAVAVLGASLKRPETVLMTRFGRQGYDLRMDITFGDFMVRSHERELVGPAGPMELSGRSFDLLVTLLGKPGELLDKSDLFDAVWPGVVVEENTLQVHMSALRKALGPGFITTVHGRGYKYVGPAPRRAEEPGAHRRAGAKGNIGSYSADCVARETEIETVALALPPPPSVTLKVAV
jgi:DNA-binding winged helix-turn-helix (wHTH) protein